MNKTELRVYGIDIDKIERDNFQVLNGLQDHYIKDDEFISISESQGLIWSLGGFTLAYNTDDIPNNIYIRII
jgi:hypothetical protein